MSNIFAISNVFKESTIGEIPTIQTENYMCSAINVLNEFNSSVTERTKKLYDALAESTSKAEENQVFESYFSELAERVNNVIKSINESTSRFVMNIDNLADVNQDTINNTSVLSSCNDFTFSKYTYKNINDPMFPRLDPVSHYQKEFDAIGRLMQELGAVSSNQAKLKVIATVYNNFSISTKNDWVEKCMEDIIGSPLTGDTNFADLLFSKFRDKEPVETTITKGTLYQLKVAMEDRSKLINMVVETATKLVNDLEYILQNFCEIMGGCSKNKIVVDTKTDGIRNTTYSGDDYTSNQLNVFLKSKIDQIVRMCNIYYIALAIKLDATAEYFDQCKEIINAAVMNCDSQATPTDAPEDTDENEPEEGEEPDISDDNGTEPDETDDEPEGLEDNEPMGGDGEPVTDDDDMSEGEDGSSEEPEEVSTGLEECHKINDAVRSYQYATYELQEAYEHISLNNYVSSKYITEAGGEEKKDSLIERVVNKIIELFNKFSETVAGLLKDTSDNAKIKKIKDNSNAIMGNTVKPHKNEDGSVVAPKINFGALKDVDIPDMESNPEKMKTLYENKESFIDGESSLSKFKPSKDGETLTSKIKDSVLDYENGYKDTADMDAVKKDYVQFILTGMSESLNSIKNMKDKLEKSKDTVKKNTQATNESSLDEAAEYFTEFSADKSDNGEEKKEKETTNVEKLAGVYFSTCSEVISAKMSTTMTVFNECYSFLSWHINNINANKSNDKNEKKEENK